MTKDAHIQGEYLPETISLSDPFPNEPPFMKKRKNPAALRFHKINKATDAEKYFFSECLLYTSYRSEQEVWDRVKGNLDDLENEIRQVKSQVMEYLESNDEARLFVEEASLKEDIANAMDPEGEQEKDECELIGQIIYHMQRQ